MDRRALFALAPAAVGLLTLVAAPARASSGGGAATTSSYVRMATVTATTVRAGGRRGVMTVETGIDVPDAELRAHAEQAAPRLRAAYNAVVQRTASALLPGAVPDVDRLSRELQAATRATLGRRGATLLLGTVMVV